MNVTYYQKWHTRLRALRRAGSGKMGGVPWAALPVYYLGRLLTESCQGLVLGKGSFSNAFLLFQPQGGVVAPLACCQMARAPWKGWHRRRGLARILPTVRMWASRTLSEDMLLAVAIL